MEQQDTLFLKIASGEIGSHMIYEDDMTCAFLSIEPQTKGHTIVIPKTYAKDIYDIKDKELMSLILSVQKVAVILKRTLHADGINILQNNEPAAGQAVFHIHFHVIPRYNGDNLRHWPGNPTTQEELSLIAKGIRGPF